MDIFQLKKPNSSRWDPLIDLHILWDDLLPFGDNLSHEMPNINFQHVAEEDIKLVVFSSNKFWKNGGIHTKCTINIMLIVHTTCAETHTPTIISDCIAWYFNLIYTSMYRQLFFLNGWNIFRSLLNCKLQHYQSTTGAIKICADELLHLRDAIIQIKLFIKLSLHLPPIIGADTLMCNNGCS